MFCHRSMDACPAPRQQIHSKLIQLTASSWKTVLNISYSSLFSQVTLKIWHILAFP
jgi:hypothetical protein